MSIREAKAEKTCMFRGIASSLASPTAEWGKTHSVFKANSKGVDALRGFGPRTFFSEMFINTEESKNAQPYQHPELSVKQ